MAMNQVVNIRDPASCGERGWVKIAEIVWSRVRMRHMEAV